jgi:CMP/dCMP kinase
MNALPKVITIDGPAGAGKSTLGERLARRLGYTYFDTGVMYRAVTWLALKKGISPRDEPALIALARDTHIEVTAATADDGRQYTVSADGEDITWELRRPEVDREISQVASYPEVRSALIAKQRMIAAQGRVVMVGRDIGSVVVPDAPLKIYLDASLEARAQRRAAEIVARGGQASLDAIREGLARRDRLDSHVMAPAADAMVLRNDDLSLDDEVERVIQLMTDDAGST